MRLLTVAAVQTSSGPHSIPLRRKGSLRQSHRPCSLEGRRLNEAVYHPFTALIAGGRVSESAPRATKAKLRDLCLLYPALCRECKYSFLTTLRRNTHRGATSGSTYSPCFCVESPQVLTASTTDAATLIDWLSSVTACSAFEPIMATHRRRT